MIDGSEWKFDVDIDTRHCAGMCLYAGIYVQTYRYRSGVNREISVIIKRGGDKLELNEMRYKPPAIYIHLTFIKIVVVVARADGFRFR